MEEIELKLLKVGVWHEMFQLEAVIRFHTFIYKPWYFLSWYINLDNYVGLMILLDYIIFYIGLCTLFYCIILDWWYYWVWTLIFCLNFNKSKFIRTHPKFNWVSKFLILDYLGRLKVSINLPKLVWMGKKFGKTHSMYTPKLGSSNFIYQHMW